MFAFQREGLFLGIICWVLCYCFLTCKISSYLTRCFLPVFSYLTLGMIYTTSNRSGEPIQHGTKSVVYFTTNPLKQKFFILNALVTLWSGDAGSHIRLLGNWQRPAINRSKLKAKTRVRQVLAAELGIIFGLRVRLLPVCREALTLGPWSIWPEAVVAAATAAHTL